MENYYTQKGVRRAIVDFVYSGSPEPQRESAFFNKKIGQIQRHSPEKDDSILVIDSEEKFARVLRAGATAFYASYWRYSNPFEAEEVRGRDLVWSLRAEDGGLPAARSGATFFVEFLEEQGFPQPLIKYSGKLGFDILIPLEDVQTGSPKDSDFLMNVQSELTKKASTYFEKQDFSVIDQNGSQMKFKGDIGACLLTELRWRRGLLLAPMSLHPDSGLVSVPVSPGNISNFSVIDASPEKAHTLKWSVGRNRPETWTETSIESFCSDSLLKA